MNLKQELSRILEGEVEDALKVLEKYSQDASVFLVHPRIVVYPKHVQDLRELVLFVNQHPKENLSLTCRAAGTDMTGGPLGESIVVDVTRHLNRILSVDKNRAVVQAGVFYRDLEKETKKLDRILPCFPSSKDLCTVGGMVANNTGGEGSLIYGKTDKYVTELNMVLADGNEYVFRPLLQEELEQKIAEQTFEGEVYRKLYALLEEHGEEIRQAKPDVSKNSSGYALWDVWNRKLFDIPKLLVGSQGTLGIITEITFRLVPLKHHSSLMVVFLDTLDPLADIVQVVLRKEPEIFESYDDHTLEFAIRNLPDFVRLLKGNIFSLGWRFLPEFFLYLRNGFDFPRLVLLAEFTGDSKEDALRRAEAAERDLERFPVNTRVIRNDSEKKKYFAIRRQSFSLLRAHAKGKRAAPSIEDITVRPEVLPRFLPQLNEILREYPQMVYTIAGHVGDGNFHIIPLLDLRKKRNRESMVELMERVHALVFEFEGSMSGEHNDGILRTPFLSDMFGERVVSHFEHAKRIFDPNNIFNPGKKVGGTKAYMAAHIVHTNT